MGDIRSTAKCTLQGVIIANRLKHQSTLKLTIVIVNYNVRYFLEQCLLSVQKACIGLDAETYVVDNASVDGSVDLVREKFPWVKVIANSDNPGFSKANNQAMRIAEGEYVLLLNPDTVVQEDTFHKVIAFMDAHPEAGGLGVKMVDGKGNFLPESKRGLPTPETSFYKIFGLNALFPSSKRINRYYLGHLSNDDTNEIEILSGAFMFMRKSALDKVGLLDEAFFMYGEDIDLSWRIVQGGWKNYYFPETKIIHYKGESTKKGSLNYVYVFYNAMVIFANKHFSAQHAKTFSFFIQIAIWMRAALAVFMRFVRNAWMPFLDGAVTFAGLMGAKMAYAQWQHKIYDDRFVDQVFVGYILIWLCAVWLGGGYDKPIRPWRVFKPLAIASASILIIYSLLPETMRFSRALVLMGGVIASLVFFVHRVLFNFWKEGRSGLRPKSHRRIAIVGSKEEQTRVKRILDETPGVINEVFPVEWRAEEKALSNKLNDIARVQRVEQFIFCAKDLSSVEIITAMSEMDARQLEFKIAPPESLYIIGSGSIQTSGEAFMVDVNSMNLPVNKRLKRFSDLFVAILMFPILPVLALIQKRPMQFLKCYIGILAGKWTWVGLHPIGSNDESRKSKSGILTPSSLHRIALSEEDTRRLNVVYARDYRVLNDWNIILNNLSRLS